ncbi:hypothetical protein [Halopiger xanaduensis]|uniref:Uncharacterized protein n=1 Tax=Halopiger xanaduensis (strain DSM 18323 / JCM 14033 / SH-6) TaxID=797210 RepID=F8D508_HALXS|nr:hypothetical protein [Halopiger xanaduensis]AEH38771.1 hypothetical protein Halxa_4168 [Halopiger xanaduensis SH-6]
MTPRLTRRQAIVGAGSSLAGVGVADGEPLPDSEPDAAAVADADRETDYPRCVYMVKDGAWTVAMPVNVHARVPDDAGVDPLAAVTDAFTGGSALRWTSALPDSKVAAWDRNAGELVAPDFSVRRPRLGDGWAHVHVWAVDDARAAIHAHRDVFDPAAAYFHSGAQYGAAARDALAQLRENGWRSRDAYSIEYGVTEDRLEQWGETGDSKAMLVP